MAALRRLDVRHNALPGLGVCTACAGASFLGTLDIMGGNPLAKVMSCRLHLVYLLPQVRAWAGGAGRGGGLGARLLRAAAPPVLACGPARPRPAPQHAPPPRAPLRPTTSISS